MPLVEQVLTFQAPQIWFPSCLDIIISSIFQNECIWILFFLRSYRCVCVIVCVFLREGWRVGHWDWFVHPLHQCVCEAGSERVRFTDRDHPRTPPEEDLRLAHTGPCRSLLCVHVVPVCVRLILCHCRKHWIIWCWKAITSSQRHAEPLWDTITPPCWPSSPSCATSNRPNRTLTPHCRYKGEGEYTHMKLYTFLHRILLARCQSWCHILCCGAGNGCQHQEQAPSSHHLYGDHRS